MRIIGSNHHIIVHVLVVLAMIGMVSLVLSPGLVAMIAVRGLGVAV